MESPSLYQMLQDFRADVREDFKEFKDDVRRDSMETRAVVTKLGESVHELSLSVARLEEVTEENTPRPLPVLAELEPVPSKPKKAVTISIGAGLGSAALWVLQKFWP